MMFESVEKAVEDRARWRVVAHNRDEGPTRYFYFDDGEAASAWLCSPAISAAVPGLSCAGVHAPDGWEPPRPRFLPIYGESEKDRAVRDLRFSPMFGRWLTKRAQVDRFDALIDRIDEYEDPGTVTLEGLRGALETARAALACDDEDCDCGRLIPDPIEAKKLDWLVEEIDEATDEWLIRALRVRGFRVDEDTARAHECAALVPPIFPWPSTGGVYFVRADDRVKIGKAKNVDARIRDLQTSAPHRLELLAVAPGGYAEESAYHSRFAESRLHGEWFRLSGEVLAHVVELRSRGERL